jgi:hypothetical protein
VTRRGSCHHLPPLTNIHARTRTDPDQI